MNELDRRVAEAAAQPQQAQINLFPPTPLPMSWTFQSGRTPDGKGAVIMSIVYPGGLFQTIMTAEDAERFFTQGLNNVKMAKTGLTLA